MKLSMYHRTVRRPGATLLEVTVVIAILAVLVGLILPAVQQARVAAARLQCANNLRQIALALEQYHGVNNTFPPGVASQGSYPLLSWRGRLLPFLEQAALWEETQAAFALNSWIASPPHWPIERTVLRVFLCPMETRITSIISLDALTSYLGVEGLSRFYPNGVFYLNSQVRVADITDGTSNTLLVGERPPTADERFGQWYDGGGQAHSGSGDSVLGMREIVTDGGSLGQCRKWVDNSFRPGRIGNPCDDFHFWSLHTGGANFLFADGSVHFLPYSAAPIMPALATRAGGESVDLPF